QMIIYIGNQNAKSHASPKLLQVELDLSTVDAQGIDNLGVRMFLRISRVSSQKRCRGYIRDSPAIIRPIKPPNQRALTYIPAGENQLSDSGTQIRPSCRMCL